MCKFNRKSGNTRIDPCMENLVEFINNNTKWKTVACCCGHGRYPPTLLVKQYTNFPWEIFSAKVIPRKFKFYKRNKHSGIYYIPEVENERQRRSQEKEKV